MMNRSTTSSSASYPSSDPYISSAPNMMMSFASYQEEWNTQGNNQNPMIPHANFDLQPPPPVEALPLMNINTTGHHGFPFYSPLASDHYHHTFIKREEGTAANLFGSTSSARIGLNLGHRTYFSSGDALAIDRLLTVRAHHQQPPRCQAEGCKADLSGSKHYHKRHKVCEFHSKAAVVIANGMQQRFCQQCSRFHVLAEFDDAKRSCRKRLADHNRRRRKPPQNTTNSSSSDKTKLCTTTATASKDSSMNYSTTTTTNTSNGGGFEGNQGDHNKAMLSLGGGSLQQGLFNYHRHFSPPPSTSNNNNNFYHQQRLFGSTSNDSSHQSTNGSVHLGHSNMFEVDFM